MLAKERTRPSLTPIGLPSFLHPTNLSTEAELLDAAGRGGNIDPNIDSIDTNVGIGIGSILA